MKPTAWDWLPVSLEGPSLPLMTGEAPDAELAGFDRAGFDCHGRRTSGGRGSETALTLLAEANVANNPEAAALLRRAEENFPPRVYREEFPSDLIPVLARPLEELTEKRYARKNFPAFPPGWSLGETATSSRSLRCAKWKPSKSCAAWFLPGPDPPSRPQNGNSGLAAGRSLPGHGRR